MGLQPGNNNGEKSLLASQDSKGVMVGMPRCAELFRSSGVKDVCDRIDEG